MGLIKKQDVSLSIVVPVYNEEKNVSKLHAELNKVCFENNYVFEIIIADDGSTDKTPEISRNLIFGKVYPPSPQLRPDRGPGRRDQGCRQLYTSPFARGV